MRQQDTLSGLEKLHSISYTFYTIRNYVELSGILTMEAPCVFSCTAVALEQIFLPLPSLALLIYGHSQGGNYINYAQVFTDTHPAFNLLSGTPSFPYLFLFLSFVDREAELVEDRRDRREVSYPHSCISQ